MKKEKNIAFIDAQNLHLWTQSEWWQIDFKRFRIYLRDKFKVEEAYFYIGFLSEPEQDLYTRLQKSGFIVVFREHNPNMKWKKKWNVDVDICFDMMKNLIENKDFDKIVLVSGDWDYIKPVKYFIEKWKFKKILFPNKKFSSLYKQIETKFRNNLSLYDIKRKIEYFKQRKK